VPCQVVSITHDRDDRGPASLQRELTPSRITPQEKRTYQQVDVMIVQGRVTRPSGSRYSLALSARSCRYPACSPHGPVTSLSRPASSYVYDQRAPSELVKLTGCGTCHTRWRLPFRQRVAHCRTRRARTE
jgi:hypothetical protein